jgi:hypothetical protein
MHVAKEGGASTEFRILSMTLPVASLLFDQQSDEPTNFQLILNKCSESSSLHKLLYPMYY